MSEEETSKLKKERIKLSKDKQHTNKPNLGTTFRVANPRIMTIFRKFKIGNKTGIQFSGKTNNWLINNGDGTFKQAISVIKKVELVHKLFLRKCKLEYIIWQ